MIAGPRHHGFTLIEILVATAIMALLTMIAIAAVGGGLDRAQSTKCLQSMRQVGAAMQMHAGDNNGRLPSSSHLRAADGSSLSWTSTLSAYLGTNFLGRCPAVPDHRSRITYGWNDLLTETNGAGIPLARCRAPNNTMVLGELATNQTSEHFHFRGASRGVVTPSFFRSMVNVECHGRGANYLFADGHAENLAWSDVQTRLMSSATPFIQP
ncbi:MAG: prepilin-type N-terminal cleavage/methylation domain-containing protein [Chthoniobacterales bacterium]|nr:prepilin-type N-terminal cleavage/methylation domain-containing protein [Chthoniobacterales bacterium]